MFFTLFNVFLLSTFLRTFAAAKSNEDEGKDIVRYKVTKLQRYKERRQTFLFIKLHLQCSNRQLNFLGINYFSSIYIAVSKTFL